MSVSPFDVTPYLSIFMKRKGLFFIVAFTIMTLGTLFTYIVPNKYEASSTVFIEKNFINELVRGIAISPTDDSARVLTASLSSRSLILKVIEDVDFNLKTKNDMEIENLISELRKNTEIKIADKGQFRVKFKYTSPQIARDYVNSLVRHYIEMEVAAKRSESSDATSFLSEQIAAYKEKVTKVESEVNQFKNDKSAVVNLDPGQLYNEINQGQQKLFDLQLRRKQLEEEKSFVKSASDPARQKLRVLQKRLEDLRVQYTENYPEVLNVKAQIETLEKETIFQRFPGTPAADTPQDIWKIDAEVKAIKENENSIQNHINESRKLLSSIPSSKNALEKLESDKIRQKSMRDLLATRNSQAELAEQIGIQEKGTSFRIVDPAVTPVQPISPNRKKLLLMSMAAGFGGAAALLLLLDQMDGSVKLVDSLKPLGLPVFAVIPFIKSEDEIMTSRKRDFKIYVASGTYFSLILCVFLMEQLGIPLFETAVSTLHLPQISAKFLKG